MNLWIIAIVLLALCMFWAVGMALVILFCKTIKRTEQDSLNKP